MRPHHFLALAGAATIATAALTGCSGSTTSEPTTSPTVAPTTQAPTTTAPTSPTPTSTSSETCSEQSILSALPEGSEMVRFDCADVSGTTWAAAEVKPGPTVFFLQDNAGTWDVSTSDEVCGTASAGLPQKLLDYCSAVESG